MTTTPSVDCNYVWRFIETATREVVEIEPGAEVKPLTYQDLTNNYAGLSTELPIKMRGAKVSGQLGTDQHRSVSGSLSFGLQPATPIRIVGLVAGGWIPPLLGIQDHTLLLDRNVVTAIQGSFLKGHLGKQSEDAFFELLRGRRARVNPLLYALEGNKKRQLEGDEVDQQLVEVYEKLSAIWPEAQIVPDLASAMKSVKGIISDTTAGMAKRTRFLSKVAPLLIATPARSKRGSIWNMILSNADACDLRHKSLVVLAALSTLVCPQANNPARQLLHLRPGYSAGDAYNALCDLRAVELLISFLALFPESRLMLLTADHPLARLWVGLEADNFAWRGRAAEFTVSLPSPMLPQLSEEEIRTLS